MKELPLFDAQAPIACTIEAGQRAGRKDLLERMQAATLGVERTEAGIRLSFPASADGLFEEFAILENQCCAFFGFRFQSEELRWDAPPAAAGMMDAAYRYFSDPTSPVDELDLLGLS